MVSELFQDMTWQWWIAQSLAVFSIFFAFSAMQQKSTTDILWHRSLYAILVFAGAVALGQPSAMIMLGVSFIRNIILLSLSFSSARTLALKRIRWATFSLLAASLVTLNLVFWDGYLSILSIVDGFIFLIAFIQTKPVNVRRICVIGSLSSITFFILIFSPVNVVINLMVLISSIMGLVKIDKQSKACRPIGC